MTRWISLLFSLALVLGACAGGGGGEPGSSTESGVHTTIQGEELVLADIIGPAVVFAWSPG
jgi:hypothetical protein